VTRFYFCTGLLSSGTSRGKRKEEEKGEKKPRLFEIA
jgi:hypothetical protein